MNTKKKKKKEEKKKQNHRGSFSRTFTYGEGEGLDGIRNILKEDRAHGPHQGGHMNPRCLSDG